LKINLLKRLISNVLDKRLGAAIYDETDQ